MDRIEDEGAQGGPTAAHLQTRPTILMAQPGSPAFGGGSMRAAGLAGTRPSSCPKSLSSYTGSSSPTSHRQALSEIMRAMQKNSAEAIEVKGTLAGTSDGAPRSEFYDEELEAEPARLGARPAVPPNAPLMTSGVDARFGRRVPRQRISTRRHTLTRSLTGDVGSPPPMHEEWDRGDDDALPQADDDSRPLFLRYAHF